jgi:hypothetical protein
MTHWNPVVLAVLTFVLACEKPPSAVEATQTASATLGLALVSPGRRTLAPSLSYPPGPWRRASSASLDRLVLWPSHLLVRYDGVIDSENVAFKMADFHSVLPAPTRSRDEALSLASSLARRARENPERFDELVREHSEDIVTRGRGGSLGGIPATQLTPWPEVLDAVTALAPGEVSDVVETWYGFHVFKRRPAPELDTVTGRRIVIGHDQARFLALLRGGGQPARSRNEALALAQHLYERSRAAPEHFPQLVDAYSELPDRIVGGDFGTWSNRELTPFPREVEMLDELAVGEVAPPLDSLFGIEIIMRVPNPERVSYAIDGFQIAFDPALPDGDPKSRSRVQAEALQLDEALQRDPSQLELLSQKYARYREQWVDGRGLPALTVAVREVGIGEMLRAPVAVVRNFVVGRRIAPRTEAPIAALIELPAPSGD